MRSSSIKNAVIALLAATNIFLLANILSLEISADRLPAGSSEAASEYLAQNGIKADESLISKSYEKRRKVEADLYTIDEISDMLLGERAGYRTEGGAVVTSLGDKKLVVTGEAFSFTTGQTPRGGDGAIRALEKMGFDVSCAYVDKNDGLIKNKVDGILVTGMYLSAQTDENGEIASLYGLWGELSVSDEYERVSIISALPDMAEKIPEDTEIEEIEKVYILRSDGSKYTAEPGWRIHCGENTYTVG